MKPPLRKTDIPELYCADVKTDDVWCELRCRKLNTTVARYVVYVQCINCHGGENRWTPEFICGRPDRKWYEISGDTNGDWLDLSVLRKT